MQLWCGVLKLIRNGLCTYLGRGCNLFKEDGKQWEVRTVCAHYGVCLRVVWAVDWRSN